MNIIKYRVFRFCSFQSQQCGFHIKHLTGKSQGKFCVDYRISRSTHHIFAEHYFFYVRSEWSWLFCLSCKTDSMASTLNADASQSLKMHFKSEIYEESAIFSTPMKCLCQYYLWVDSKFSIHGIFYVSTKYIQIINEKTSGPMIFTSSTFRFSNS